MAPSTEPVSTDSSERAPHALMWGAFLLGGFLIGLAWRESLPAPLGLIGLSLYFFACQRTTQIWVALSGGGVTGFVASATATPWLVETLAHLSAWPAWANWTAFVFFCLIKSTPYVLFAMLWHPLREQRYSLFALPGLFVLLEWHFSFWIPTHTGYLLTDYPLLCQPAEIGGVLLVSLLATLFATVVWVMLDRTKQGARQIAFAERCCFVGMSLLLLLSCLTWAYERNAKLQRVLSQRQLKHEGVKILIVQSRTSNPDSLARMRRVTEKVASQADLVIWPENAIGKYSQRLTDFGDADQVRRFVHGEKGNQPPCPNSETPLLVGGESFDDRDNSSYISAFLLAGDATCIGRHDKIELMPGGEYLPGQNWLPWKQWLGTEKFVSRGRGIAPIGNVNGIQIGAVLCCEDMYPYLTRRLAKQDADFIASLGCGAAFGSELPLRQHFRIARLRAIENRMFLIRCASRGVSAVISPDGRVQHEIPTHDDGAMLVHLPSRRFPKTTHTVWGFSAFGLLLTITLLPGACEVLASIVSRTNPS